jgi:hypothetical protein
MKYDSLKLKKAEGLQMENTHDLYIKTPQQFHKFCVSIHTSVKCMAGLQVIEMQVSHIVVHDTTEKL